MTVNKFLLAIVTFLGVSLLWLVASALLPRESARAAVRPEATRLAPGERPDPAALTGLVEITHDQRLSAFAGVGAVLGVADLNDVSGACVAALTRRADQLRRQPELVIRLPQMPPQDSCQASQSPEMLQQNVGETGRDPANRLRRLRTWEAPAAAWLNSDVRSECARWLDPTRLNVETDGDSNRMWCG